MYTTPNDQNGVIMFCVTKQDQPNKPRFITYCGLKKVVLYKKEILLPNTNKLIELVAAYPVRRFGR